MALGAAAFYGSSDFMGALATRRSAVLAVALLTQIAGFSLLVLLLPFMPAVDLTPRIFLAGAAAGVFGGAGLVSIYRVLARGPMSVVAPTTALSASSVPILAGILMGERPGVSSLIGIAIAFVAVTLITREHPAPGERSSLSLRPVLPAVGAGALLGMFFVFLHLAGDSAGLWPMFAARLTSMPLLAALLLLRGETVPRGRSLVAPVVLSGMLDMCANVLFLMASQRGMLAVVSTITGLYPAVTIVLAQVRLGERMRPIQFTGLGVAVVAAALVAS